jgi:creatinine amidohydrolase
MKSKNNDNICFSKVIKFNELNWKQIEDLDQNKTIFFLPISPLEEHGPHLPVGTDLLISNDSATEAIKILNKKKTDLNYVLLPAHPVGYCKFNTDFPGSISVSSKVVREIVYSIGAALSHHGFKFMIISTFHMAITHLKGIYSGMKFLKMKYNMSISEPWGPYYYGNKLEKKEPKLGFDTSKEVHAGFRETSLMKYQYPYYVDESFKKLQSIYRDLQSPSVLGKMFKQLGLKDGYVGSPARANVDYGRWFFSEIVNVYVRSAIDLYEGKKQEDLPKKIRLAMKALLWQ